MSTSTALRRWLGSTNPDNLAGSATFESGGKTVTVSLGCFEDARALAALIDHARLQGNTAARRACAVYMRGAADQMEGQQA